MVLRGKLSRFLEVAWLSQQTLSQIVISRLEILSLRYEIHILSSPSYKEQSAERRCLGVWWWWCAQILDFDTLSHARFFPFATVPCECAGPSPKSRLAPHPTALIFPSVSKTPSMSDAARSSS